MTWAAGRAIRGGRSARVALPFVLGVVIAGTAACAGPTATVASASPSAPASAPPPVQAAVPPAAAVLGASRPERVLIPAIGVDSALMDLGLQADGTLEVPPTGFPAGWFTGAPTPGERGPAVIAGHVDWGGSAGVFSRLHQLVAGDEITVPRADGTAAVFRVDHVQAFDKDDFPTAAVYGDLDHAGLRVITCGGDFDHAAHSYVDDVVVFADLVPPVRD